MRIIKERYKSIVYLLFLIVPAVLVINVSACNKDENINVDKTAEENKLYRINENLSIIIPDEWVNKYTTESVKVTYFNGEIRYPADNVTRTCFKATLNNEQVTFLDIVPVPKAEIMDYLNWGMYYQFFIGYCDNFYYFSSGSFGLPGQEDKDEWEPFSVKEVEEVVKRSFSCYNINLYWEFILHDFNTLHGRNDKLPFEMNIQYIYDIRGDYKYTDETGNMAIEKVIEIMLSQFAEDLCKKHVNWRFKINRCEVFPYETIYYTDNYELLKEDFDLSDFYNKGYLDKYIEKNCWIFISGCRVYDFNGFLSMISSEEFRQSDMEYVGEEAGVWVIEKDGNIYHMYRPDIPFAGQGA